MSNNPESVVEMAQAFEGDNIFQCIIHFKICVSIRDSSKSAKKEDIATVVLRKVKSFPIYG